jgi:hypothetical protein
MLRMHMHSDGTEFVAGVSVTYVACYLASLR